jgi:uncharacterized membrane protein YesL
MKYVAKNSFLVIFILVITFNLVLDIFFNFNNSTIRIIASSFIAVVLSPRKKKINTLTGERTQITWVFLKEPIFLDK